MKKLLLCLMVGVMSLTSCELSDPDGLADPMKCVNCLVLK